MSSGERKQNSLNHGVYTVGLRDLDMACADVSRMDWKVQQDRVIAPYAKTEAGLEVSQVGRST